MSMSRLIFKHTICHFMFPRWPSAKPVGLTVWLMGQDRCMENHGLEETYQEAASIQTPVFPSHHLRGLCILQPCYSTTQLSCQDEGGSGCFDVALIWPVESNDDFLKQQWSCYTFTSVCLSLSVRRPSEASPVCVFCQEAIECVTW